ncbi:uncharacterized protein [Macrobrachium rosenbergii]|uniref:uncharacterized protein n=1 Tax=Macrobrachium rosenbergii TaxID=79674 RepID=UPI0034D7439B
MLARKKFSNLFIVLLATSFGASQSPFSARSVGNGHQPSSHNATSNTPVETTSERASSTSKDLIEGLNSSSVHLFLCDHPPNKFSPLFLGQSKEDCQFEGGPVNKGPFTETMVVCWAIYETIYKKAAVIHGKIPIDGNYTLILHADPALLQICLPLLERFDSCEKRDYITICWDARVAFVHDLPCHRPSESNIDFEILMGTLLLWNDTECFHLFCDGHVTMISRKVNGMQVEMINPLSIAEDSNCNILNSGITLNPGTADEIMFVANSHWPCCYGLYIIIWIGNPKKIGLQGNWGYLPLSCQIAEVFLIILVAIVAFSGFIGNLIIILVMIKSKHCFEESTIIRVSLAASDFLISVFVSVPSFFYHISPLVTEPNYYTRDLTKVNVENGTHREAHTIATSGYKLYFEGILLLQGLIFSACHIISLLSIFLLSLERYLITWRPLKYKAYSNPRRIRILAFFVWVIGVLYAFLFSIVEEGHIQVVYLNFEKLPIAFEEKYSEWDGWGVFKTTQFWMLYVIGLSVTLLSVLSIRNFHVEKIRVATEWRNLNMKVLGPYSEENRYITNTLIIMLLLFLLATAPRLVYIALYNVGYFSKHEVLFSYLSWWALMAGTAWNPWIYNFRSRLFRTEATRILLPAVLKRKLKRLI